MALTIHSSRIRFAAPIVCLAFEMIGAVVALRLQVAPTWFDSLWFGGAIASFPGFLAGVPVQAILRPGSVALHRTMVVFVGAITLVLCVAAALMLRSTSVWPGVSHAG